MTARLRRWWRGYDDADVATLRAKLCETRAAGSVTWLTTAEHCAFAHGEASPLLLTERADG